MFETPDGLCYLNGQFGRLADTQLSVTDRGFLYGDGIYEEVPVYDRRLFRFEQHMNRLMRHLTRARITNPLSVAHWQDLCRELVRQHPADDQLLYLQVTRGRRSDALATPGKAEPTVFATCSALTVPTAEQRHQGVACVTCHDERWGPEGLGSIARMGNVLARQRAVDAGAFESLLIRNGHLSGAAGSDVWVVLEGAMLTPLLHGPALDAVHDDLISELCREAEIPFNRRALTEADLRAADEIILSAPAHELLPATRLDGSAVGHGALKGKPGPVYGHLFEAFRAAKLSQTT